MTQAQKAFEEWCKSKKIGKSSLAHEDYKSVWRAAWKARGELDAKICEATRHEQPYVADFEWGALKCAEAIRKVDV